MARSTIVNPPDPKKIANRKVVPSPPAEKPRASRTIDGTRYVLVNGGWRREATTEKSED